jgi:hypothetical protein
VRRENQTVRKHRGEDFEGFGQPTAEISPMSHQRHICTVLLNHNHNIPILSTLAYQRTRASSETPRHTWYRERKDPPV